MAAQTLLSPQRLSARVATRRGYGLVLMGLIVPGSAQVVAGNKKLGRFALGVWLTLLALAVAVGVFVLAARTTAIGLLANPIVLTVLSWLVPAVGLAWALLLLNAWWLAAPRQMTGAGRVVTGVLALVLAVAVGWASWSAHVILKASANLVSTVFVGGGTAQPDEHGRYNILLLGGDAGAGRKGLRPDSITVASIDATTGRTVLLSLPRNLQRAPFPADSPLHKLYPNGYWCASQECLLNAVYMLAEEHKNLFPGVKYPGVEATQGVVEETLGLTINYWAMVDLKGFQKLIDAVGGIRLDIAKRVPIGSLKGKDGITGWIKPGKNQHLDGFHALWFARSREYSDDYERMARQKCVMNAMLKQLNPTTVMTKFESIAEAGGEIMATDLPASQIGTMLDLASKARSLPMASVNFTPPLITPANPDFSAIRQTVDKAIADSQAKDKSAGKSSGGKSGTSKQKASTAPAQQETEDLDSVCSVSK